MFVNQDFNNDDEVEENEENKEDENQDQQRRLSLFFPTGSCLPRKMVVEAWCDQIIFQKEPTWGVSL